jgi:serine/threonine protein kinase
MKITVTFKMADWERVNPKPLGGGGQSDVYLVRTPERTDERKRSRENIDRHVPMTTGTAENITRANLNYVEAIREYNRPDLPTELGAMKVFKLRDNEAQSLQRLGQEIAVLDEDRPGLPKLLGSNVDERWMVTEYFPHGTLEDHLLEYKGKPALALEAFRSVVETTSHLHKEGIVHRDFKPANIFVRGNHELVLGDFGLVYVPDKAPRITAYAGETVGASDFIPPWGDMGVRLENVEPNFDVYMLGKVLWCMVAGRPVLKREYFDRVDNDVTVLFRDDPHAYIINELLKKSVVEDPKDCFSSAGDLLLAVDTYLQIIKRGGQLLRDGIPRPCHVCGNGHYGRQVHDKDDPVYQVRVWTSGAAHPDTTFHSEIFICDSCGNMQFFRTAPR